MCDLTAPHFTDKDKAREHLEALRWPDGPVCPHCGVIGAHYQLKGKKHRPGLLKCFACREQFSVTIGTVFEDSKVPLHKWLLAAHLMSASKKGISSHQLHRMLGVTYKTAWFMTHRLREAMKGPHTGMLGGGGAPVEVDEAYWGTVPHAKKHKGGGAHKMKIVSLVERKGEKRSFHVPNVTADTLRPILRKQIKRDSHLMTDEAKVYTKIGRKYFDAHGTVNHSESVYSRRTLSGKTITTNTVESSFAILKRGLYGTFHHVSEKHLQRYADEFDFRWNNRSKLGISDVERAETLLRSIEGKRLIYRQPHGAPDSTIYLC